MGLKHNVKQNSRKKAELDLRSLVQREKSGIHSNGKGIPLKLTEKYVNTFGWAFLRLHLTGDSQRDWRSMKLKKRGEHFFS